MSGAPLWADRSPRAVGLVSGTRLDFHLHLLPYPENLCAVGNLCNCTQQLWPKSQGPKHFNSVASRQIPGALQNKDLGDQGWFLGCEFIPHLNTRTCTLQTQQELGTIQLPKSLLQIKSGTYPGGRNVHRRTETAAAQKSQATWQKAACREAPPTQTQVILPSFLTIL